VYVTGVMECPDYRNQVARVFRVMHICQPARSQAPLGMVYNLSVSTPYLCVARCPIMTGGPASEGSVGTGRRRRCPCARRASEGSWVPAVRGAEGVSRVEPLAPIADLQLANGSFHREGPLAIRVILFCCPCVGAHRQEGMCASRRPCPYSMASCQVIPQSFQ
jgi:hypothetical protein